MHEYIEITAWGEIIDVLEIQKQVRDTEQGKQASLEGILWHRYQQPHRHTGHGNAEQQGRCETPHPSCDESDEKFSERWMSVCPKRLGDHETGNDEENVDAEIAAGQPRAMQVIHDHRHHGQGAQTIHFRPVVQAIMIRRWRRPASGPTAVISASGRSAHGVHPVRDRRRRRPAELAERCR